MNRIKQGFKYLIKLGTFSVWGKVLYASTLHNAHVMAAFYGPGSTIEPL